MPINCLKAAVSGLSLGTDAPRFFKALVEGTCFGAKAIVDRFIKEGVAVKGLIGIGGVARKSPYIMQTMADVMNMPIKIHRSEQTCATGAAMFAATAAGIYEKVEDAMNAMGRGFDKEYFPDKEKVEIYAKRYLKYQQLGEFIEQQTILKSGVTKYEHIQQEAYEANMQLPKLGLVLIYIWKCKCSRQKPWRICHQAKRRSLRRVNAC